MSNIFHTYLYDPILSALVFIYENLAFHDLGFAIIILTIVVRLVLFPIFYRGAKDQAMMQILQPKIKKIQDENKENKEQQAKELMALYKEHSFNPFSGFFLLLLQLPVFLALFQIFRTELSTAAFQSQFFLNFINLGEKSFSVAIVAALLQFIQSKIALAPQSKIQDEKNPIASAGKMMMFIGPAFTLFILLNLPSALGFFWIVSSAFSIIQQIYINKKLAENKEKK